MEHFKKPMWQQLRTHTSKRNVSYTTQQKTVYKLAWTCTLDCLPLLGPVFMAGAMPSTGS